MKPGHRKVTIGLLGIFAASVLPVAFAQVGVDNGVAMTALGIIGLVVGGYFTANVKDKGEKNGPN